MEPSYVLICVPNFPLLFEKLKKKNKYIYIFYIILFTKRKILKEKKSVKSPRRISWRNDFFHSSFDSLMYQNIKCLSYHARNYLVSPFVKKNPNNLYNFIHIWFSHVSKCFGNVIKIIYTIQQSICMVIYMYLTVTLNIQTMTIKERYIRVHEPRHFLHDFYVTRGSLPVLGQKHHILIYWWNIFSL